MMRARQKTFNTLLLVSFLIVGGAAAVAAPEAELWERWTAHDPDSDRSIDHSDWREILQKYLTVRADGVNRFRYGQVTDDDSQALENYIKSLESVPIDRYNRDQQLAFWINLYNAVTVWIILEHYPVESILDIKLSPGFFSFGPWDKKLVSVEGERVSLNDIEHRILRPIWPDPRIHYAVNCASIGCPDLMSIPYAAGALDAQLTDAAKAYVNHPRGVEFEGERLVVSSIYHWYKEDFGDSDVGVIRHLKQYAQPSLAAKLESVSRIDDHRYDWALNDAAPGSR